MSTLPGQWGVTTSIGLASRAAALFLAKSALLGARIVTLLAIARYCPSDDLANVSYALALCEVLRLIADWGTDVWSIRAIALASSSADQSKIVASCLLLKFLLGLVACLALVALCAQAIPQQGAIIGALASAMLLANLLAGTAISYLQARDQFGALLVPILPGAVTCILVIAVIGITHNAIHGMIVLAAGEILAALILILTLTRATNLHFGRETFASISSVARASAPVAAFGVVLGLYSRLDTLVLAAMSFAALANYTVAHRMFLPFQVAVTTFGSVIYSSGASRLAGGNATRTAFRSQLMVALALTFVASLLLWIGGEWVIATFLPWYSESLVILRLLCVLLVILSLNSAYAGLLFAHGRLAAILRIALLDLLCATIAMILFIPKFGALGAAIGLTIGAVVNAVAVIVAVRTSRILADPA